MAAVLGLECLRCGARYGAEHHAEDCPRCRADAPSNLVVVYEGLNPQRPGAGRPGRGLWRYGDILPVPEHEAVSLGEGGTPLLRLDRVGRIAGLDALSGKDESRNPTWSFKDRLACVAVSVARTMGAKIIVTSSTGNAGAAAAAYAARAGLACVVFTARGATGPLVTQMRAYGAVVVAVENKADRWPLMHHAVREFGWFPTSPFFGTVVGSNPYGIEGYKSLAYEIAEAMDWDVPDWCVLPVCYGDAMIGMWRGFEEMLRAGWIDRVPRLAAAEIYGSLGAALRRGGDALTDMPMTHDTVAKSTTATRSTYQALHAIRASGGTATIVGNAEILGWQETLAREEGLYVEPAAAGSLAAAAALRKTGVIGASDRVVALLTASGLKDPAANADRQGDLAVVPGDPAAAFAAMSERGLFPG